MGANGVQMERHVGVPWFFSTSASWSDVGQKEKRGKVKENVLNNKERKVNMSKHACGKHVK